MSEQPASRKTAPQGTIRQRVRMPQSRESRFIGYLVLGFGVLAVIAVLILAFSGSNEKTFAHKPATGTLMAELTDKKPTVKHKPQSESAPKKELFFSRDPHLDASRMEGDWQASIGRYTAVLQIRKGVYQVILADPDPRAVRYYSSGIYKTVEDILMLNPQLNWPEPSRPAGASISYQLLTRASFPFLVKFQGDRMLWQNAPQSEKRVVGPGKSPLFMSERVDYVTWQKMK